MPRAFLDVTPELLMAFCEFLTDGKRARWFQVTQNGLPRGTKVIGSESRQGRIVRIELESDSFKPGEVLPGVAVEIVYDPEIDNQFAEQHLVMVDPIR